MAAVGLWLRRLSICIPTEQHAPGQYSSALPVHARPNAWQDLLTRSAAPPKRLHIAPIPTPCSKPCARRHHSLGPAPRPARLLQRRGSTPLREVAPPPPDRVAHRQP